MKRFFNAVATAIQSTRARFAGPHDIATETVQDSSQDPRLQFLLRVGGGMEGKPRYSMTGGEIDTITRLHDLATAASKTGPKDTSVEVTDVELINNASKLVKKARGMLEMIHAIDQIGISTSAYVITDRDRQHLERWRTAYFPDVKSTTRAPTLIERYCHSLRQMSEEGSVAVEDYIRTLKAMSDDGRKYGFGWFGDSSRGKLYQARDDYFRGADSAPAPSTILWDKHDKHQDSIRAHVEGLRKTIVSVLTDLHTLSKKANLSSEVTQALDAPWDDMEKELETLELPRPPLWIAEQARVLKVRPDLLVPPSGPRPTSVLHAKWI